MIHMKDDETLPVSTPTSSSVLSTSSSLSARKDKDNASSPLTNLLGRGRYKFWALAAILLLAFWSMLTGTVSLRWSAGNLNRFHEDYESPAPEDLDVLDLEEREKMVQHMWDAYTNGNRLGLRGFWQDAFVSAYEDLTSDVTEIKENAISEIAKMSVRYIKLHPPPVHSASLLSVGDVSSKQAVAAQ